MSTEQNAEKAETWRHRCKHYGGCTDNGRGLCTVPDDPAYIAEREAKEAADRPAAQGQESDDADQVEVCQNCGHELSGGRRCRSVGMCRCGFDHTGSDR